MRKTATGAVLKSGASCNPSLAGQKHPLDKRWGVPRNLNALALVVAEL